MYFEDVHAVGEPALRYVPNVLGRGRQLIIQHVAPGIRAAVIDFAAGQDVALSAEAADAFDTPYETGFRLRLGAFQFVGRGALSQEKCQFFIEGLLHHC